VGPAASTTEVEEDVDGGALRVLLAGPTASTTEVEDDRVWIPPYAQILIDSCKVKHGKQ
jgi:hypothetical protein